MIDWKRFWLILGILWMGLWLAWTFEIYEADDVFVPAFAEVAIVVPLAIVLVAMLLQRILNSLGVLRRKDSPKEPSE